MIEVLKQALDALETEVSIDWTNNDEFNASAEKMHDAITSLHQAIAQLEIQEPICPECKAEVLYECVACSRNNYPPQRTWVGLTADEQSFVFDQVKQIVDSKPFWVRFADAIEAKVKEKQA